jgi:hypothetical protein
MSYSTAGMSGASPASVDYVMQMALGVAGGQLANQTTAPAAPSDGAQLYAQSGKVWTKRANACVNLLNGTQNGISAAVTVASSSALTEIAAYTVPAGEAAAGSVYKLCLWGTYSVTSTPTLLFQSWYGGITGTGITGIPAILTAGTEASCLFGLTAYLQFYSASVAQGVITLSLGTAAATDAATVYVGAATNPGGVTGIDTSAAQKFSVSFKWSASSPSNTLSVLGGYGQRAA